MVTFSVPTKEEGGKTEGKYFRFSVPTCSVLFAGSRFGEVSKRTCQQLIQALAHLGFSFYIGVLME